MARSQKADLENMKKGSFPAEVIADKKLIKLRCYAIASKATIMKPKQLNVPEDKFQAQFGYVWPASFRFTASCMAQPSSCAAGRLKQIANERLFSDQETGLNACFVTSRSRTGHR